VARRRAWSYLIAELSAHCPFQLCHGPYPSDEGCCSQTNISVQFEVVSTLKEERQNSYMDSLEFDGLKVGPQVDFLLIQPELRSKTMAVSHDSIYGHSEYRGDFFVSFSSLDKVCNLDLH
jgi:hypothetical protein